MSQIPTSPTWFRWADAERRAGVRETPGPKSTARIIEYRTLAKTPLGGEDGAVPWCAIGVNAALESTGVKGSRSAMARSFERSADFAKLSGPALGAIVTLWRGSPKSGLGHVGLYAGHDSRGRVVLLGGNQGDAWSLAPFAPERVTGFWWPRSVPLPQVGRIVTGDVGSSGVTEV